MYCYYLLLMHIFWTKIKQLYKEKHYSATTAQLPSKINNMGITVTIITLYILSQESNFHHLYLRFFFYYLHNLEHRDNHKYTNT